MTELVIDASLTLAWCFSDEDDAYAESVLEALPACRVAVPDLWPLEVANALLVGERRKRLSSAETSRVLLLLAALPILVEPGSAHAAFDHVMPLARQHGLTVYDAAYLELAMRRGLPLGSLDDQLRKAARAVGVALFAP